MSRVSIYGGDDAVVLPVTGLRNPYGARTVEAWIFPFSHGRDTDVMQFGRTVLSRTDFDGFAMRVVDGFLQSDLRVNGILRDAVGATGQVKTSLNVKACAMIGNEPVPGCTIQAGNFGWQGLIDEVSFYDRALSDEEILLVVEAGPAGKCKAEFGRVPPIQGIAAAEAGVTITFHSDACFRCLLESKDDMTATEWFRLQAVDGTGGVV